MNGFYTKEVNNNGDYEITFYTENREDFKKVQSLCRELIGHGKPVSTEGDLISRGALLKEIENLIGYSLSYEALLNAIDNAPTVEYSFYQEAYQTEYEEGKNERQQGEWLHKEFDSLLKEYGQCSNCLQRERVGNFCRNCGADMRGKEE